MLDKSVNNRNEMPMVRNNLARMIALAEETFKTREDPQQISVNEEVIARLHALHPSTMMEEVEAEGPIAWTLVIPTTKTLMTRFIRKEISERELLDLTSTGARYEAIYLCSALVLPEHRRRGMARSMLTRAIDSIRKDHPVEFLFCWPFSSEGKALAETIAQTAALPLQERPPD